MNFEYASAMDKQIGVIQGELHEAVKLALSKADPEEYEAIKKSLGLFMGRLDMELLWPIHRAFPELDLTGIPVPPAAPPEPLAKNQESRISRETAMTPISEVFAKRLIDTCHATADLLASLLCDAPESAHPDIRKRIGEILAYTADLLIHPAIHQHPALNPDQPQP